MNIIENIDSLITLTEAKIKFSLGDKVIVNTGDKDTKGEIWDKEGKATHGIYWKKQDSYLVRFPNGTAQYISAEYIRKK